jgi:hypothetical protein
LNKRCNKPECRKIYEISVQGLVRMYPGLNSKAPRYKGPIPGSSSTIKERIQRAIIVSVGLVKIF